MKGLLANVYGVFPSMTENDHFLLMNGLRLAAIDGPVTDVDGDERRTPTLWSGELWHHNSYFVRTVGLL